MGQTLTKLLRSFKNVVHPPPPFLTPSSRPHPLPPVLTPSSRPHPLPLVLTPFLSSSPPLSSPAASNDLPWQSWAVKHPLSWPPAAFFPLKVKSLTIQPLVMPVFALVMLPGTRPPPALPPPQTNLSPSLFFCFLERKRVRQIVDTFEMKVLFDLNSQRSVADCQEDLSWFDAERIWTWHVDSSLAQSFSDCLL